MSSNRIGDPSSSENSFSSPSSRDAFTSCHILWSTQSGRAKACARRVARILKEQTTLHLNNGMGCPFDDDELDFVDLVSQSPHSSLLILFVSTTGDGEHCDTIQQTWKRLLQKSLKPFASSNAKKKIPQFALFCLGDRAYGPQFCAAGRKLAVRLLQLGMTTVGQVGYGDDNTPNGGVFGDLDVWLVEQLLPLCEKRITPLRDNEFTTPYTVYIEKICESRSDEREEWKRDRFEKAYNAYFSQSSPVSSYDYDEHGLRRINTESDRGSMYKNPLLGTMTVNKRITASDWEQDTRHFRIDVNVGEMRRPDAETPGGVSELPYQAGDVASIVPFNSSTEVNRFLSVLPDAVAAHADNLLCIETNDGEMTNQYTKWPNRCTLRGWLTFCADIQSLPEREDLRELSRFCSPDHELCKDQSEMLMSLSETSRSALYADYILREKRSWTDVLYDFQSLRSPGSKLNLEVLFALLPKMRPREFSIASSPRTDKLRRINHKESPESSGTLKYGLFSIELCVAVVRGTTRLGRQYHGLCSEFLANKSPTNDQIPNLLLWIRPGSFGKLPLDIRQTSSQHFNVPILCVGAGTGVAPMRSLLLERNAVWMDANNAETEDASSSKTGNPNDNILVFGCRRQLADFYYSDEWNEMRQLGTIRLLPAFSRDQVQKVYVQRVLAEADDRDLISSHILERSGAVYIAGGPNMARAVKEEIIDALAKRIGDRKQANRLLSQMQRAGKFSIEAWS